MALGSTAVHLPPGLLYVDEAARRLGVPPRTVRLWIRRGVLRGVQPAGPNGLWLVGEAGIRRLEEIAGAYDASASSDKG